MEMKIVVTGSLGNISKPLTQELVKKGHSVTVITTRPERQNEIENIGATAAIGIMQDIDFLTDAFHGAEVVYLMEAIGYHSFFDHTLDVMNAVEKIASGYKEAILLSGVKRVVHLSSIGAHTGQDSGILAFHYIAENILRQLRESVSIKFMRPVGFYNNMYGFIKTIKSQGVIVQNYGGDEKEPWVSPGDIASAIADEMEKLFDGRTIRYIASDEVSPNDIAQILGEAIGKKDLHWITISDDKFLENLISAGMNPKAARGFTAMNVLPGGAAFYTRTTCITGRRLEKQS